MGVIIYLCFWVLLGTGVVGLMLVRRVLTRGECIILHVRNCEAGMAIEQLSLARKVELVDRWGKDLTILLGIYSLAIPAYIAALGM